MVEFATAQDFYAFIKNTFNLKGRKKAEVSSVMRRAGQAYQQGRDAQAELLADLQKKFSAASPENLEVAASKLSGLPSEPKSTGVVSGGSIEAGSGGEKPKQSKPRGSYDPDQAKVSAEPKVSSDSDKVKISVKPRGSSDSDQVKISSKTRAAEEPDDVKKPRTRTVAAGPFTRFGPRQRAIFNPIGRIMERVGLAANEFPEYQKYRKALEGTRGVVNAELVADSARDMIDAIDDRLDASSLPPEQVKKIKKLYGPKIKELQKFTRMPSFTEKIALVEGGFDKGSLSRMHTTVLELDDLADDARAISFEEQAASEAARKAADLAEESAQSGKLKRVHPRTTKKQKAFLKKLPGFAKKPALKAMTGRSGAITDFAMKNKGSVGLGAGWFLLDTLLDKAKDSQRIGQAEDQVAGGGRTSGQIYEELLNQRHMDKQQVAMLTKQDQVDPQILEMLAHLAKPSVANGQLARSETYIGPSNRLTAGLEAGNFTLQNILEQLA